MTTAGDVAATWEDAMLQKGPTSSGSLMTCQGGAKWTSWRSPRALLAIVSLMIQSQGNLVTPFTLVARVLWKTPSRRARTVTTSREPLEGMWWRAEPWEPRLGKVRGVKKQSSLLGPELRGISPLVNPHTQEGGSRARQEADGQKPCHRRPGLGTVGARPFRPLLELTRER